MNPAAPRGFPARPFYGVMGWTLAIGLSLGLNLFLFGIMPGLIHRVPGQLESRESVRAIQVVRVKRPEPPPKKREWTKPPEPKQEPKPVRQLARVNSPRPAPVKPKLPFELNPALPEVSDSLEMPPLSHLAMNVSLPKGLYMASELDAPLTALAKVPPIYPLRASRLGLQGWVKIRFTVTLDGGVENVEIIEADPQGVFENAVINCVSQWRFKPGTVEGVAVAAQARTTIRFQLEK